MHKASIRFQPWIIWVTAVLFFFFDYVQQVAPSIIGSSLVTTFHINAVMLGSIAAAYYYSYATMQIPAGLIIDHFGPRRPLMVAATIAGIGTFLFYHSDSAIIAFLTRMLIGFGTAFSFVSCLKLVSSWFPESMSGVLAGMSNTVGMIGAVVVDLVLIHIVKNIGWRNTMQCLAGIFIIIAILFYFIIKDHPTRTRSLQSDENYKRGVTKTWQDIKHILQKRPVWINGIFTATINIPFVAFGALWGAKFLQQSYHLSVFTSSRAMALVFVGAIPGSIFWGWFSDYLKKRKLPMLLAALGALVTMVIILYIADLPIVLLDIILFMLGFCASGNALGYAYSLDIRPPGSAGISLGFVNTLLIGGAAASEPITGWLLDMNKATNVVKHSLAYSVADYKVALSFVTVCLLVACFSILLLQETHCHAQYH